VIAAVAGVAAIPLAHACARAHPETATTWTSPYCPVCGAWPALAEERGLERSRRHRCGTCGTDWWAAWLTCPYCGEAEHERLATLSVEGDGTRRVDACHGCHGYLKTVTLLTAAPDVATLDAETVELDVAARARGYTRPVTPGHRVRPRVVARPGLARRLLAWTP
jgi:FdhE protein